MSAPFQVGDRVRVNNTMVAEHDHYGVIVAIDTNPLTADLWPYELALDGIDNEGGNYRPIFDASELELVERAS